MSLLIPNIILKLNWLTLFWWDWATENQTPPPHPGWGGGVSQKNWVGVRGLLPKILTLFMTKICDIPYPIYDLTITSKSHFRPFVKSFC